MCGSMLHKRVLWILTQLLAYSCVKEQRNDRDLTPFRYTIRGGHIPASGMPNMSTSISSLVGRLRLLRKVLDLWRRMGHGPIEHDVRSRVSSVSSSS